MKTILVTGGAGFIGHNFVKHLLATASEVAVVCLDKLTYAGSPASLGELAAEPRYRFVRGDICDRQLVRALLGERRPDAIVNLAAESHVDRSIVGPDDFIQTNVIGTFHLLDETRHALARGDLPAGFRFLHVSTDEVYGALGPNGAFSEASRYQPSSPYSASKAASDHLVRAYGHTYELPVITTNCSNNYGPYQFPEKLIPLTIAHARAGKRLPVYGRGENVRDWIYVEDHCRALALALAEGRLGETYVVGTRNERKNLEVVETICAELDGLCPRPGGAPHTELIEFVTDRPGHDFRYAIDPTKIERELGFRPEVDFADGIRRTIRWYLDNEAWVRSTVGRDHPG
jgi:dTDP-glucose 4,6-dehydratase